MRSFGVDQQPQGRLSCAAGKQRAQHRVLNAHNRHVTFGGNREAAMCGGGIAPDRDSIPVAWQAKMDGISRQLQNPAQAFLPQKPAVIHKKPPVLLRSGGGDIVCLRP